MSKYDPLRDYLRTLRLRETEVSFRDLQNILGFALPASAERPQWWANQVAAGRPQREAWREAGFDAFLIRGSNRVKFRRV